MSTTRKDPTERKQQILQAALELARKHGYTKVTRHQIAEHIECSPSLPMRYFKTMAPLRRAVMREAVRVEDLRVIAQGLAASDPQARKADPAVQSRALATLAV